MLFKSCKKAAIPRGNCWTKSASFSAQLPSSPKKFRPIIKMPKILLVEDNEMNRDMLSRRLERKGYTITLALDGAEGLQKARAEVPDIILMDMSLPVLDGWEATRQLKADEATRRIPIIALTAHAMANDEQRAREAGCDDFDTKPIELPRLLAKIETLLQPGAVT